MPLTENRADRDFEKPETAGNMGARMRDTKQDKKQQRRLKRQVACNSYAVDPERVATAIIVKLAQEGEPFSPDPFAGGPSRPAGGVDPFRQAA